LFQQLRSNKVRLVAISSAATCSYLSYNFPGPLALIIGNESAGLPEDIIQAADDCLIIPMAGRAESLNAAVAGAVILFEAARQRRG
jgi:TrmH family RNA methyltransferase